MFEDAAEKINLRRIDWQDLSPGMVFIGGVRINDIVPYELRGFPVITDEFLKHLRRQYRFLDRRPVIVGEPGMPQDPLSADEMREKLNKSAERLQYLNGFRKEQQREREAAGIAGPLSSGPVPPSPGFADFLPPSLQQQEHLVFNRFSSFTHPYTEIREEFQLPSLFSRPDLQITMEQLLSGRLFKEFRLPKDIPLQLHIVIDYSYSMELNNKLECAIRAANYLYKTIPRLMENTTIKLYAFSDDVREIGFPVSGRELDHGDTYYAAFLKRILRVRDREKNSRRIITLSEPLRHKILLLTDGEPNDCAETLRLAEHIKSGKIDYTQLIFDFNESITELQVTEESGIVIKDGYADNRYLPESAAVREFTQEELEERKNKFYQTFTRIAESAGGNQIIVRIYEYMKLISVEVYDRYLGLLTIAERE
jgi:hypothetical protein